MTSCGVMNFPGVNWARDRFAIDGHRPEQHGPSPFESDGPWKLLLFAIAVDALAIRFELEL